MPLYESSSSGAPVPPRTHVNTDEQLTVVLDTSAIMADAQAYLAYPGAQVVIPLTVIDELDNNKTRADVAGRNARDFLRSLERIRQDNNGDVTTAVALPEGTTLRIEPNGLRLGELEVHHLSAKVADHRILAAALGLVGDGHRDVRVVSNDMALRLKASVLGLSSAEHTPGKIGLHAPNRCGYHHLPLSYHVQELLKGAAPIAISDLPSEDQDLLADVLNNEFVIIEGTALCFRRRGNELTRASSNQQHVWGMRPRNKEQAFALDLLLDQDVPLVVLRGHAGTGKSLLATAAALEQVFERQTHDRLMILRPMIAVGNQDLGFLPGDVAEKTAPWFTAVVDTLVALHGGRGDGQRMSFQQCSEMLGMWVEAGKVELAPLTFLRGRSLERTIVILDEAQNLESAAAKTVISRLGEGSKLIITGDDGQIDQPFASALTCGLNVTVDAFAGVDLFGQVHFAKGERSRLADLAAELM